MHCIWSFVVVTLLWWLALARLTRLLTKDAITDFIRVAAYRKSKGADTTLTYFVQCPWCVGMWLALVTAAYPLWLTGAAWQLFPIVALSGSYVAGIFAEKLEDDDDAEIEITDDDY